MEDEQEGVIRQEGAVPYPRFYGYIQLIVDSAGRIDNFAHLGGAAAGYLAAGAMGIKHFRESNNKRLLYAAVIVILSIAGILIGFARFSGYRYRGNFI